MATDTNDEVAETEQQAADTNVEVGTTVPRPDLAWDDEARGLCVRLHGNGAKSFVFVYRIGGRQRFIRIGQTPVWSLETARIRAKELRSIVEQGRDPARENRGREIPPVENIIQYIAKHLRTINVARTNLAKQWPPVGTTKNRRRSSPTNQ
jgi:Arm DNA-binding domain